MFDDIRRTLYVAFLALLLIAAFGASSASNAQPTIPPDEARAFVRAALAASQVNEAWRPRINRATSEVEAERLREQEAAAMRQAIRDVDGITVEHYRVMYKAARSNPELAAYLTDLFEQELAEAKP